jgi:hypothetical protein
MQQEQQEAAASGVEPLVSMQWEPVSTAFLLSLLTYWLHALMRGSAQRCQPA